MNSRSHRDLILINTAGFLRSLGVGLLGVVLGIYLFRTGLSSFMIGMVIGAGLVGSAVATVVVSFAADRLGRRHSLLAAHTGRGVSFQPRRGVVHRRCRRTRIGRFDADHDARLSRLGVVRADRARAVRD